MNKSQTFLTLMATGAIVFMVGCSSPQNLSQPTATVPVATASTEPAVPSVAANAELITIAEAAEAVADVHALDAVAKKYGYKTIDNYAIHRLDSYDKMLYKNCTPAKAMGKGVYADTPKPMKRGTSSYVALGNSITIGVFNNAAYQNLVDQVRSGGFTLVEEGYEDKYTNGTVDVYCYAARKTVRLEKAAN